MSSRVGLGTQHPLFSHLSVQCITKYQYIKPRDIKCPPLQYEGKFQWVLGMMRGWHPAITGVSETGKTACEQTSLLYKSGSHRCHWSVRNSCCICIKSSSIIFWTTIVENLTPHQRAHWWLITLIFLNLSWSLKRGKFRCHVTLEFSFVIVKQCSPIHSTSWIHTWYLLTGKNRRSSASVTAALRYTWSTCNCAVPRHTWGSCANSATIKPSGSPRAAQRGCGWQNIKVGWFEEAIQIDTAVGR